MFARVALALALFLAGSAHAADRGELPGLDPTYQAFVTQDPPANPLDEMKAKQEEEEKAREERLKALEAAQSQVAARVVVLAWPGAADIDYDNGAVQSNVRQRIARPDAKFVPDMDLYQVGRRSPDKSLLPAQQPGSVPIENTEIVMSAVHDIESVPWNGMSEADWGITANSMAKMVELIWFVDRKELREPLFQLYVQIGRAAENMNNPVAPFYQQVGGQLINYYWYLAGAMAYEEPALLDSLTYPDLASTIEYYKGLLDSGQVPMMTLSFEQGGVWDPKKFATEYQVYINGLETLITDPQSLQKVPPGRVDVFLKRSDGGYSIADRVELQRLEDKVYFVRDVARKRMGIDLIDQLMKHPNECSPRVEGTVLTDLAIYAMLHKDAEVFVAIPVAGDPRKVQLWRWNHETKALTKVLDETQGYPLRFAVLAGAGTQFSAASVGQTCNPNPIPGEPDICTPNPPELTVAGVPLFARLQLHYGRLMVAFGGEFMPAVSGDPPEVADRWLGQSGDVYDSSGNPVLKSKAWSYQLYTGVGVIFLKKASLGMGPKAWLRFGGWNLPHVFDLTAHGGLTFEPPGMEQKGRVRLILDADGWVGMLLPYGNTTLDKSKPLLTFGIAIGAGTTF